MLSFYQTVNQLPTLQRIQREYNKKIQTSLKKKIENQTNIFQKETNK